MSCKEGGGKDELEAERWREKLKKKRLKFLGNFRFKFQQEEQLITIF
jgi:hypothetical protein